MIRNPRPTRAEVGDVANAIYDGADAVMLSGETAIGTYPQFAVQTMARIAEASEPYLLAENPVPSRSEKHARVSPMIAYAAAATAESLEARGIVTPTLTGRTPRLVSAFRPKVPIFAVTSTEEVARKLSLCWGVRAICGKNQGDPAQVLSSSQQAVLDAYLMNPGDIAVFTLGDRRTSPEASNLAVGSSQRIVHATNVLEVVQVKGAPSAGAHCDTSEEPSSCQESGVTC